MKSLSIFGFTGSIGTQALNLVAEFPDQFEVDIFVCKSNSEKALELIKKHMPKNVFVADESIREALINQCPDQINFFENISSLRKYMAENKSDIYLSAISSYDCLDLTLDAAASGKKLLLANKEALVVFGKKIIEECQKNNTDLIPIDSEHFSLFSSLKHIDKNDISKIFITASGGPFVGMDINEINNKTPQEALNHPNWSMGAKISIDSATLVNKCFELIEAKYLFDLDPDRLDIVIQRQSIIHSMVELNDGSVEAQLSKPSMLIPLAYGLLGKHSKQVRDKFSLNMFDRNYDLTIEEFPSDRQKILEIARDVMSHDDNRGLIFATLNEYAVNQFLSEKIKFGDILKLIINNYYEIQKRDLSSIEELNHNRNEIIEFISSR